jgi:hypothetical protein
MAKRRLITLPGKNDIQPVRLTCVLATKAYDAMQTSRGEARAASLILNLITGRYDRIALTRRPGARPAAFPAL